RRAFLSGLGRRVSHTAGCDSPSWAAKGEFIVTTTNGGQAQEKAPQLNVLAQYIKDLSFENPNAPRSLQPAQQQPNINIQINVSAKPLSETEVEVDLKIEGKAESGSTLLFQFDLVYAGVFRLQNIPQAD